MPPFTFAEESRASGVHRVRSIRRRPPDWLSNWLSGAWSILAFTSPEHPIPRTHEALQDVASVGAVTTPRRPSLRSTSIPSPPGFPSTPPPVDPTHQHLGKPASPKS